MIRDLQYYKFCAYGFLKNLRFFEIFFILYLKDAGLDYLSIGLLYSIRQITINLLEIPSGIVADSWSRKRALLISITAYLITFVLFYYSRRFTLLALAMILYGCGEAFRSGTHKAIILHYLRQKELLHLKTRFYGSTRSWSQFGSAVVSLLAAGFHYFGAGYRMLFLFTIVPYLLEWLLIASYPSDRKDAGRQESVSITASFKEVLSAFTRLFKSSVTLNAMFSSAAYTAYFKTLKDYLQPILLTITAVAVVNNDPRLGHALLFGLVYFGLYLLTATISRNAWRLEEKNLSLPIALNRLYLAGTIATGISGLMLSLSFSALAAGLFIVLYMVQNARRPLMVSYLSNIIENRIMASGLSAVSQLETVLVALFAPLLGYLIDMFGLGWGLAAGSSLFIAIYPLLRLPAVRNPH